MNSGTSSGTSSGTRVSAHIHKMGAPGQLLEALVHELAYQLSAPTYVEGRPKSVRHWYMSWLISGGQSASVSRNTCSALTRCVAGPLPVVCLTPFGSSHPVALYYNARFKVKLIHATHLLPTFGFLRRATRCLLPIISPSRGCGQGWPVRRPVLPCRNGRAPHIGH
jgi:hypothetical protein